jgi:hypothetical protein
MSGEGKKETFDRNDFVLVPAPLEKCCGQCVFGKESPCKVVWDNAFECWSQSEGEDGTHLYDGYFKRVEEPA